jgi:hypothetical protein
VYHDHGRVADGLQEAVVGCPAAAGSGGQDGQGVPPDAFPLALECGLHQLFNEPAFDLDFCSAGMAKKD